MCAYAEARRLRPDSDVRLLSLGTGSQTRSITYDQARGWGALEWAQPIIDVVLDGSSDAVDYQLDHLLGERHYRLQATLTTASDDLDDADPANIAALEETGRRLVELHDELLDELARDLQKDGVT
jgi:hypothetical protein